MNGSRPQNPSLARVGGWDGVIYRRRESAVSGAQVEINIELHSTDLALPRYCCERIDE